MGELGVLFNPGMRYEQEEKLAKQMIREDEGTGRKGRRGIDLESGVVVIGADDAPGAEPESSEAETAAVNGGVADSATDFGVGADSATDGDSAAGADRVSGGPQAVPVTTTEARATAESAAPAIKPGEPRVARHASTTIPSGKARRRAHAESDGAATAARPERKSQRRAR